MTKTISLLSIIVLFSFPALAGEHGDERRALPRVTNEVYKTACGSCHFAYQPGLLPARSWVKIINSPGAHPGGDLAIDKKTKAEIRRYLTQNSAENTEVKRSQKILASIGSGVPTRISEIPYIMEKHAEIDPQVFSRPSVSWRGNCIACHKTAENGDYDDDYATIPR